MKWFLALVLMFLPHFAFAQEIQVEPFCKSLSQHVPDDDVNFKPGRDDVVPADLGGGIERSILDPMRIPVEIELQEFFDLGDVADIPGIDLEPSVADIEVYQDGRVLYNGQDVSRQVLAGCDQLSGTEQSLDGQGGEDALNSVPEAPIKKAQPVEIRKGIEGEALRDVTESPVIEGQYP